jgi:hypothetical protein
MVVGDKKFGAWYVYVNTTTGSLRGYPRGATMVGAEQGNFENFESLDVGNGIFIVFFTSLAL